MIGRESLLAAFGAGMMTAGAIIGAVVLATAPEDGWVCGNAATGQVVDATRSGRSYEWTDSWGVRQSIGPDQQAEWLCAKVNKSAAQMTSPLGEFDL